MKVALLFVKKTTIFLKRKLLSLLLSTKKTVENTHFYAKKIMKWAVLSGQHCEGSFKICGGCLKKCEGKEISAPLVSKS